LLRLVQDDRQIQHLREQLGGFSHRCRNLLNGLKMSFYFLQRGVDQPLPEYWSALELDYRRIEALFDQLQAIYRPVSLTVIRGTLRCLIQDRQPHWAQWFASGQGTLEIAPPKQESHGEFDPMCLSMGLDALARWRAAVLAADQSARFSWRTGGGQFEVRWEERERCAPADSALFPLRSDSKCTAASAAPQPLALPLLARMLTAHGGTLEWNRKPHFQALMRWPLNQSPGASVNVL
jgi:hypothetical protein